MSQSSFLILVSYYVELCCAMTGAVGWVGLLHTRCEQCLAASLLGGRKETTAVHKLQTASTRHRCRGQSYCRQRCQHPAASAAPLKAAILG